MNFIYDIETYKNAFTFAARCEGYDNPWVFEISDRRDDWGPFVQFITTLQQGGHSMVGFNNVNFDYPVLHAMLTGAIPHTAEAIYQCGQDIIKYKGAYEYKPYSVWASDYIVPQIDLFKIHHFDNENRDTSLKDIEFNLRMHKIQDLPYSPHEPLQSHQVDELILYNIHDVDATQLFYDQTKEKIEFREKMTVELGMNCTNFNDTKIGKSLFIKELEKRNPGCCYHKVNGKKTKRQTIRPFIDLGECVFPYVKFEHPEFNRVLNIIKNKRITKTKGALEGVIATIDGFDFDFGLGGIHGSIKKTTVLANDEYEIIDCDVTSLYPSIVIENQLYPEHIGPIFAEIYRELRTRRLSYDKGTVGNLALKLALNGTYGDTNSKHSPLFDSKTTMTVTLNGQLLMCMLAEQLMKIPNSTMIQINTDGITMRIPRTHREHYMHVCNWWSELTMLQLEYADYSRMMIRDISSYVAEDLKGKVKLKGYYDHMGRYSQDRPEKYGAIDWAKNHSGHILRILSSRALLEDIDIEKEVMNHPNIWDFFIKGRSKGAAKLTYSDASGTKYLQKVSRGVAAFSGGYLARLQMPGKDHLVGTWAKKNKVSHEAYYEWSATSKAQRLTGELDSDGVQWNGDFHTGATTGNHSVYKKKSVALYKDQLVQVCNDLDGQPLEIDYAWYINEIKKNVDEVREKVLT